VAVAVAACGEAERVAGRVVATEAWDTLFIFGTAAASDASLGIPTIVLPWNDLVVVADEALGEVIAIDRSGAEVWRPGSPGAGPGEYHWIRDLVIAPNGNLWVVDGRLGRLTEIDEDGNYIRNIAARSGQRLGSAGVLDGALVMVYPNPHMTRLRLENGAFVDDGVLHTPLEEMIPPQSNLMLERASAPDGSMIVIALRAGDTFLVLRRDGIRGYRYIEPVPFVPRRPPGDMSDNIGYSVRHYGATSASIARDTLYFLFGGRSQLLEDPGEPSRHIDVYDADGGYVRTLVLPFGARAIGTDGTVFYVARTDPYPSLIALVPRY
jgi:hypothetical protein